jgi:hypothetical protein
MRHLMTMTMMLRRRRRRRRRGKTRRWRVTMALLCGH